MATGLMSLKRKQGKTETITQTTSEGDATSSDVLETETFSNSKGLNIQGTIKVLSDPNVPICIPQTSLAIEYDKISLLPNVTIPKNIFFNTDVTLAVPINNLVGDLSIRETLTNHFVGTGSTTPLIGFLSSSGSICIRDIFNISYTTNNDADITVDLYYFIEELDMDFSSKKLLKSYTIPAGSNTILKTLANQSLMNDFRTSGDSITFLYSISGLSQDKYLTLFFSYFYF